MQTNLNYSKNGSGTTTATKAGARATIETVVREEWGRVLAVLVGGLRDFDLAEDVLQDAVVQALKTWPDGGIPDHPRAWLLQTARRKAIDRFRRDANFDAKRGEIRVLAEIDAAAGEEDVDTTIADERLSMVFTCCHPALSESARVALTLRTLGGLTTGEIARAFLVPETTMGQRLTRAKNKIRAANIPYRVPPPELWPDRMASVLAVLYLIFNEGYAATSGPGPTRADLCQEAIRLAGVLVDLVPDEPEAAGLLALMLLHDSRRPARGHGDGLVTLEYQDRRLWNRDQIGAGTVLLKKTLAKGRVGPYQVQAAISAVHADAASHERTDWREITALYGRLHTLQPSPVVRLNGAVALSFADGPAAGFKAIEGLAREGSLARYQPFHAARADILRRMGRREEATEAYSLALELTDNAADRAFLQKRLVEIADAAAGPN